MARGGQLEGARPKRFFQPHGMGKSELQDFGKRLRRKRKPIRQGVKATQSIGTSQ